MDETLALASAQTVEYVNPGLRQLSVRFARVSFSDSQWAPVKDQSGFGIEYAHESPDQDIGWEIGLLRFEADERDVVGNVDSVIGEVYAGARRTFGHAEAVWRPHFGGGASLIGARVRNQAGVRDSDNSLAAYVHAGLSAFLSPHFSVGFDVRGLFLSQLRLHGEKLDTDYLQIAITASFVF